MGCRTIAWMWLGSLLVACSRVTVDAAPADVGTQDTVAVADAQTPDDGAAAPPDDSAVPGTVDAVADAPATGVDAPTTRAEDGAVTLERDAGREALGGAAAWVRFDLGIRLANGTDERPIVGARVRVDDATGASVELTSDGAGRCPCVVRTSDGPWTVTATMPGRTITSYVNVCEPLRTPLFLYGNDPPAPSTTPPRRVLVRGDIRGRRAGVTDWHMVLVEALGEFAGQHDRDTYSANLRLRDDVPLQLLAMETGEGRLLNYVVTPPVPFSEAPSPVHIQFPDPPAPMRALTFDLRVQPGGLPLDPPRGGNAVVQIYRYPEAWERVFAYFQFYTSTRTVDSEAGETVAVDVPPPPLEPNLATVDFRRTLGGDVSLSARVRNMGDRVTLALPRIRALDASGDTLDTLAIRADAPGYGWMSVSIQARGRPDAPWRIYNVCAPLRTEIRVPELPTGVTMRSLGLAEEELRVSAAIVHEGRDGSGASAATYTLQASRALATIRGTGR